MRKTSHLNNAGSLTEPVSSKYSNIFIAFWPNLRLMKSKQVSFFKPIKFNQFTILAISIFICFSGQSANSVNAVDFLFVACSSGKIREYDTNLNLINTFGQPYNGTGGGSIAIDKFGTIYSANEYTPSLINTFDVNGNYLSSINTNSWISALAVDTNRNIYVSEGTGSSIGVYSQSGQLIKRINSPDYGSPQGMAFDSQGNLFVTGGGNVVKFDSSGQQIFKFASNSASDIAIDKDGYLYVTNWAAYTVSKYDNSGNFQFSFGSSEFKGAPLGVITDSAGNIYVSDWKHVLKFDSRGSLLSFAMDDDYSFNGYADLRCRMVLYSSPFSVPEPSPIFAALIGFFVFTIFQYQKHRNV
ncbi:MAG: NHL repeat-containing protein [bacterium]